MNRDRRYRQLQAPTAADGYEDEEDALAGYPDIPTRLPNSAVRYEGLQVNSRFQLHRDHVIPLRAHRVQPQPVTKQKRQQGNANRASPPDVIYAQPAHRYTDDVTTAPKKKRRSHPLLYLGFGMLAMLALWTAGIHIVSWWQTIQDDWHYGRPRTYQIDAVVGHNDSSSHPSHFIAVNLNSHVEIIEFPGGDPAHARVYIGPQIFGPGSDLAPVTVSFSDPNHTGKPTMIVQVQRSDIVYLNKAIKGVWQFVPQQSQ